VELKRLREQQRRASISEKFIELTTLLRDIDPAFGTREVPAAAALPGRTVAAAVAGDHGQAHAQSVSSSTTSSATALTRVDIIEHSIAVLRRIHAENEARKRLIEQFRVAGTSSDASSSALRRQQQRTLPPPLSQQLQPEDPLESILRLAGERAARHGNSIGQIQQQSGIWTGSVVRTIYSFCFVLFSMYPAESC
jgi:hypothetical protein